MSDDHVGDNCGAGYLNDNFFNHVLDRLEDEDYLDVQGTTRTSIVRRAIPNFEENEKRFTNIYQKTSSSIEIPGLRGDMSRGLTGANAKRFDDNSMNLDQ